MGIKLDKQLSNDCLQQQENTPFAIKECCQFQKINTF